MEGEKNIMPAINRVEAERLIMGTFNALSRLLWDNRNTTSPDGRELVGLNLQNIEEIRRILGRGEAFRKELFEELTDEGYTYLLNKCHELADIYRLETHRRYIANFLSEASHQPRGSARDFPFSPPGITNAEDSFDWQDEQQRVLSIIREKNESRIGAVNRRISELHRERLVINTHISRNNIDIQELRDNIAENNTAIARELGTVTLSGANAAITELVVPLINSTKIPVFIPPPSGGQASGEFLADLPNSVRVLRESGRNRMRNMRERNVLERENNDLRQKLRVIDNAIRYWNNVLQRYNEERAAWHREMWWR